MNTKNSKLIKPLGAMTALITPFKNDKVDFIAYERLIKRQINNGINCVVPAGTTGESATLSTKEHKQCIEVAIATCKNTNTLVLAGAGSNCTREAIIIAKFAQEMGANGVLSVCPYYNRPNQAGLYAHFKAIANAIDIPFMPYNVPARTSSDLLSDTIVSLYNDIDNVYAIKEATGYVERCVEISSKCKDIAIISGNDGLDYPLLASGAKGFISVTANLLPDIKVKLFNLVKENKHEEARILNEELYELNCLLFDEPNPVMVKKAMQLAGVLDSCDVRSPLLSATFEGEAKLKKILTKWEIQK
jgi:4-hydroxy-tetrahydrodipicolinate synthase